MGGILGIGGSSQKTDRANQLQQVQNETNLFNYGIAGGEQAQATGQADLGDASQYFKSLLTAGRTDTAARAAPAINSTLAQKDAAERNAAATGTARTGGAAAQQAEAGTKAGSEIDNIINANLIGGQKEGAAGLANAGTAELSNSLGLLGTAGQATSNVLNSSIQSRQIDPNPAGSIGSLLGQLLLGGESQGLSQIFSGGGTAGAGSLGGDLAAGAPDVADAAEAAAVFL